MKKRIALLLVISVLFSALPVIAADATYTIKTAEDFMNIKKAPDATYILAADIVLPVNYEPIDFSGSLIGDNETNLRSITVDISKPSSEKNNGAALFSFFRGKGAIKNIRLKGAVTGNSYVGGFVAQSVTGTGAEMSNLVNEATIRATGSVVAGIIAKTDGNISVTDVCNLGNVYGVSDVGGICGNSSTNTFYLCRNYGNITASGNYCGGITGNNYAVHDYCYNSGNISGYLNVGGIVGLAIGNRNMTNLYNTGEVVSQKSADENESGGILGGVYNITTSRANISNAVSLTAPQNVSGEFSPIYPSYTSVGETNYVKAENCFYYSKELIDDGKDGTTSVNDENYSFINDLLNDIDEKFTAIERENNVFLQDEVLTRVNARVALFVGNNKAVVMADGKARGIRLDDESVNVVPVIKNSVTLVPIGFVARALDCTVNWIPEERSVEISGNGRNVTLYIGSNKAYINGEERMLSYPAYIENGRTMVPLRSVSEMLNKYVFWDNSGLILLSDSEINPSEKYLSDAIGLYLCSPHDVTAKMKTAEPGDTIIIKNGTYSDVVIDIDIKGRADAPVILKAQTPGGVEFTGTSHIIVTGEYITIRDLYFNECRWPKANIINMYKTNYSEVTGCYFYKSGSSTDPMSLMISMNSGSCYNKIHHNTIERAQSMGVGIVMDYSHTFEESNHDNRIYSNYFLDSRQVATEYPGVNNGLESVAMGASWGSPYKLNNYIEYNRFENIYGDGGEGICLKTSGNYVRYNTFVDSSMSGISGRYGDDNIYEGNFLFNVKSGFGIFGHGHLLKNNYIYSPARNGFRTYSCPGDSYGIEGDYQAVHDTVIEGNIYIDTPYAGMMLGDGYNSDRGWINIPSDIIVRNNTFFLNKGAVLRDYASFNITFENNTATLRGSAVMGDAKEGFTQVEDELVFDGEIYLPKSRLDFDKQGLISVDEVGPENRWWVPLLRCATHKYFDYEPEKAPLKITPSVTEITMNNKKGFDIDTITITAEYDAPELFSPKFDNISSEMFSVKASDGFKIDGTTLVPDGATTGKLTVTYKGVSADIKVKTVGNAVSGLTDNFDILSENYINKGSQNWEIVDGKLENTSGGSGMLINYGAELTGDYEISCDVTLKKKNETTAISGGIVVGYTEAPEVQYTALRFAPEKTINAGIYNCDWYWSEKKSETTIYPEADKTYHITVRKSGDDLVALTDGVVTSVYENGKNLEGKFGFITYGNIMSVDNLSVKSITEVKDREVKPLNLFVDRIDTMSVNVGTKEYVEDAVYYRVFRQGTPVSDSNGPSYYSDLLVRIGKEYNYGVKAYDEYGKVVAEGNVKNTLSEAKDGEFFEITNLYLKRGTKENPYRTNVIRSRNRGLAVGNWAFFDRQYEIVEMPDYLKDAGYIKTANSDKSNEEFLTESDDWMKFDINRSATVYVLMFHTYDTPLWLKDWSITLDPGFVISDNPLPTIMYSKHFDVEEGKTTTVQLGGFKYLSVMYLVFVKPDVMPEYVELKKVNGSVA